MSFDRCFWCPDTTICVRCPGSEGVFNDLMAAVAGRGYQVGPDPRIEKEYPTLGPEHRRISRPTGAGLLEVGARFFPVGMELQGYQNVVFENKAGGRYDFGRFQKMPYLIRLRWLHFRGLVYDFLRSAGLTHKPDLPGDATPLERFNSGWGADRFRRGPDGWPDDKELSSWSRKSADGGTLVNGSVAWILSRYSHRWVRGRVYGGINGMWHLYHGRTFLANENAGYYWLIPPADVRGRQMAKTDRERRMARDFKAAIVDKRYGRVAGIAKAAELMGYDLGV